MITIDGQSYVAIVIKVISRHERSAPSFSEIWPMKFGQVARCYAGEGRIEKRARYGISERQLHPDMAVDAAFRPCKGPRNRAATCPAVFPVFLVPSNRRGMQKTATPRSHPTWRMACEP